MDINGLLSDNTYFCTTTNYYYSSRYTPKHNPSHNNHHHHPHQNQQNFWLLPPLPDLSSSSLLSSSTNAMSSDSATRQWTLVLVLTALFLSLVVVGQIIARYGAAYWAAPREIAALLDSADSSLHENESYDRDVAKVARRDDKLRLGRLLGEIQRAGDDLREDLNNVLVIRREDADDFGSYTEKDDLPRGTERRRVSSSIPPARQPAHISSSPSPRLRTSARILWAAKRTHLEERLRRLDLLRMRFLVVYMSIVAATATAAAERVEKSAEKSAEIATTNAAAVTAATAARATSAATATTTARPQPRNTPTGRTSRASRASRTSRSTSSSSSDDDDSCSSSSSSAANSPLMSATTPSMPTSPSVLAAATKKSTASIVAASIAAAAAAAVAAGDTDDVYYPSSPTSIPASPGFGTHPFLRSIQQQSDSKPQSKAQSQPPSPPATPQTGTDDFDSLRRKPPSRRVTTLGIRPPDATPEHNHRAGWMGVVQELQRSPLLHKRHTSIEMSMARR